MRRAARAGAHLLRLVREEEGTMSVEMVVLVPVLLLVVLVAVAGARLVSTQATVDAASRDAARAASMARSAPGAAQAARTSLEQADTERADCSAATDVSGFGRGGTVRVTVTCRVHLADLGLVFLPGTTTVTSTTVSVVDTRRGSR